MDSRAWDERYAASELVWSSTPNQFVAVELSDLKPGRALDLAAGEGRNALWLAERGWAVTAVDFSLVGLDKGRRIEAEHPHGRDLHIEWVHADVLSFEPGPVGYDLALIAYLQLPAAERRTAVRVAFGALAVGGTLLVVAHDSSNLTAGTGGPQDPAVLYTAEEVLGDLDGERFDAVRAERVERVVPADDEHGGEPDRTAYDALVRLVRTA
ncbi:MAG: class I SAM-dependent methyltransferase [Nocardioides sp.]